MFRVQVPGGKSRTRWHILQRLALVIRARCGADQIHLDVQVGDVFGLDGDVQGGGAIRRW